MTCTNPRAHHGTRLFLVAATALLTACGTSATPSGGPTTTFTPSSGTTSTAAAPTGPTTSPTPIVPSHPVTFPPTPPATVTLTGTILEGTRPTCHILQADGGRYVLTGGPAQDLQTGDRVTVDGSARPHLMSSCGGTTFVVTRSQVHS